MSFISKIFYILGNNLKKKSLIIISLLLINSTLDLLGIALLLPVLNLITNMEELLKYEFIAKTIQNYIGPYDKLKYIQFGLILVLILYFIKSLALTIVVKLIGNYTLKIQNELYESIYLYYLRRPYIEHVMENSSKGINLMCSEVGAFIGHGLQSGLTLANELIVVFIIIAFLSYYNFNTTFTIFIIIIAICLLFYYLTKKPIRNISVQRDIFENLKVKIISESLGSIKEIILYNKISFFYDRFKIITNNCSEFIVKLALLQQIPKIWIDFLAILSLCIIVQQSANNVNDIIKIISVYIIAAYRLIPSITRILNSAQLLESVAPIVNKLYINLNTINKNNNKEIKNIFSFEKLELLNVNYKYTNSKKLILNNINIKINSGDFIGIIGPSGSGKTSLVNIIAGLLKPVSGDLLINNFKISENFDSNFRFISYVSQNNLLLDDTVINNITLCYQNKHVNWDKLNNAIDMAQLRNTINKYPDGLNQIVGEIGRNISGGEIQRIAIARSLYMNSSVLILDEPTSALDTETENNILDLILKLKNNKTIILITHNLKLISKCNKIYKIDNGYCKEDNCI